MGKSFITDEVNDTYTAQVTNGKKMKVETGASTYKFLATAHSLLSAEQVVASACWLKSVIIGQYPATAGCLTIINTSSATMGDISAFGTSGDNIVGKIAYTVGAASGETSGATVMLDGRAPVEVPFNVYLSSGLAFSTHSAHDYAGRLGCFKSVTAVYQT